MESPIPRRFLILGANGQDGRLLTKKLLHENCVVGSVSRSSIPPEYSDRLIHYSCDVRNTKLLFAILKTFRPNTIIDFSSIRGNSAQNDSLDEIIVTAILQLGNSVIDATCNYVESIDKQCKLILCGSSLMYSNATKNPRVISENSLTNPTSYYGIGKAAVFERMRNIRSETNWSFHEAILFNHDSRYRSDKFLIPTISQKISEFIKLGMPANFAFRLSFPDKQFDIHCAEDTIDAIYLMSGASFDGDLVIASGKLTSARELIIKYLNENHFKTNIHFETEGYEEASEGPLIGNPEKARILGWESSRDIMMLINQLILEAS